LVKERKGTEKLKTKIRNSKTADLFLIVIGERWRNGRMREK